MNKRLVHIVVAANLLACLWLVLRYPQLMISPGEVLDAHHSLEQDCFACHSPFTGSNENQCIDCHAIDQVGLTTTAGIAIEREADAVAFHQQLTSKNCMGCHKEHHGLFEIQMVPEFSHQLLALPVRQNCNGCHQVPDKKYHHRTEDNCSLCHNSKHWEPAHFDHTRLEQEPTRTCESCHQSPDDKRHQHYGDHCQDCHSADAWKPATFDHGQLEQQADKTCDSCHQAPRDKLHKQFSGQCQLCHGTDAWEPADYDHDDYFRFDRHHKPRCDSCHIDGNLESYTCYDCHEHSERKVRREHLEEDIKDFDDCTECHRSGDEDEAERIWKKMRRGDSGKGHNNNDD